MLSFRAVPAVIALCGVAVACSHHDPAEELEVLDIETYWIVDSPRDGENFIAPAIRFRLRNKGSARLSPVQARARFPGSAEEEPWGSIQQQVSHWREPLLPGEDRLVTVRSVGRYQAAADPQDMLRSPGFQDPRAEVFVKIGNSNWAKLAEAPVERRIGAPGTQDLVGP
jgi:hypothetical protein